VIDSKMSYVDFVGIGRGFRKPPQENLPSEFTVARTPFSVAK